MRKRLGSARCVVVGAISVICALSSGGLATVSARPVAHRNPQPAGEVPTTSPRVTVPRPPDVDHYLRLLKSPSPNDKAHAAFHLADRGQWAASAIPDLIEMLKERCGKPSDNGVGSPSQEAVRALAAIGRPALEPTRALLEAPSPWVRESALRVLGEMRNPEAIGALVAQLKSTDRLRRKDVVEALAKITDRRAVPVLTSLLKDPDFAVRGRAAQALGQIGARESITPLVEALRTDPETHAPTSSGWGAVPAIMGALMQLGDPAFAQVLTLAEQEEPLAKQRAITLLGLAGYAPAREAILAAMDSPSPEVRVAALGAAAGGKAHPLVFGVRARPTAEEWRDPRLLPAFMRGLRDGESRVRRGAAYGLGRLREAEAASALIATLEDRDEAVSWVAIEALCSIDDDSAREVVAAALRDLQSKRGKPAQYRLVELDDPRVVAPLLSDLHSPVAHIRDEAVRSLARMKSPQAVEAIRAVFRGDNAELKSAALSTLSWDKPAPELRPALLAALRSYQPDIRFHAALALARLGEARALQPLLTALRSDRYLGGTWQIFRALGDLGDRRAVPGLVEVLDRHHGTYRRPVAEALHKVTGVDLGENPLVWRQWWKEQGRGK